MKKSALATPSAGGEPIILRACLLILDHEARYATQSIDNQELLGLFASFESIFSACSLSDQQKVMPHILTALVRVVARVISIERCIITNKSHLLRSLQCMNIVLKAATQELANLAFIVGGMATTLDTFKRLLNLLVICFECQRVHATQSSANATGGDDEEIVSLSFLSFLHILSVLQCSTLVNDTAKIYSYKADALFAENIELLSMVRKLEGTRQDYGLLRKIVSGPLLAQILQICLHFSTHSSKQIASYALRSLYNVQLFVDDIQDWRNFVPGVFTALHNLCLSGYKR
jgi:hypothetical protein